MTTLYFKRENLFLFYFASIKQEIFSWLDERKNTLEISKNHLIIFLNKIESFDLYISKNGFYYKQDDDYIKLSDNHFCCMLKNDADLSSKIIKKINKHLLKICNIMNNKALEEFKSEID